MMPFWPKANYKACWSSAPSSIRSLMIDSWNFSSKSMTTRCRETCRRRIWWQLWRAALSNQPPTLTQVDTACHLCKTSSHRTQAQVGTACHLCKTSSHRHMDSNLWVTANSLWVMVNNLWATQCLRVMANHLRATANSPMANHLWVIHHRIPVSTTPSRTPTLSPLNEYKL